MEVWIGLAHVKPRPGNDQLSGSLGAFVPCVGLADNESNFTSALVEFLHKYEFEVVEIKDTETFQERQLHACVDQKVCELARKLSAENPIELGSFHSYKET